MANNIGTAGTIASSAGKIAGFAGLPGVAAALGPIGAVLSAVSLAQGLFGGRDPKRQSIGISFQRNPENKLYAKHVRTKGVGMGVANKFAQSILDAIYSPDFDQSLLPTNFGVRTNVGKKDPGTSLIFPGGKRYQISSNPADMSAILQKVTEAPASQQEFSQRPSPMKAPGSLNELAAFAPEQQRSALATKGVNSGLGGDEQSYYRNLVQRSLIGEGNKIQTDNPNFLMPIESQYFSQQGLNTSDIMEFLKGLHA